MDPPPTPLPYEAEVLHCVYVNNSQPPDGYEHWYNYTRVLDQCYGTVGYAHGYESGIADSTPAAGWLIGLGFYAAVTSAVIVALFWQAIRRGIPVA